MTASAGVAPNKFLAKIASDWKEPDGLFVIQPEEVDAFLLPLPVGRLPGVGKVMEEKLKGFEVYTIAGLRRLDLPMLENRFGRYGVRLYELARGVDESKVVPDRPTQSISAEDTFERDVPLMETEPMIRKLAELTWAAARKESRIARTVVLNFKTAEFKILTRSHTPSSPPSSCDELSAIALWLGERVTLGPHQRFRLVGVGLSNFLDPEDASAQPALFRLTAVKLQLEVHPNRRQVILPEKLVVSHTIGGFSATARIGSKSVSCRSTSVFTFCHARAHTTNQRGAISFSLAMTVVKRSWLAESGARCPASASTNPRAPSNFAISLVR